MDNSIESEICNAMYNFMTERIDTIKPFCTNQTKFIYKDYNFVDKNDLLLKVKTDINVAICCLYEILWCNTPKEFMWKTFMSLINKN